VGYPPGNGLSTPVQIRFLGNPRAGGRRWKESRGYDNDTILLFELDPYLPKPSSQIYNTIKQLTNWFYTNNLIINTQKTFYTIYHKKSHTKLIDKIDIDINIKHTKINRKITNIYLGLTYNQHLNWDIQLKNQTNKLINKLPLTYSLYKILNYNTKIKWYYAFIYSTISAYIIHTYNPSNPQTKKLHNTHIKIIRILFYKEIINNYPLKPNQTNISKSSIYQFMLKNKLLTLNHIHSYTTTLTLFKYINTSILLENINKYKFS
jgi:hypothetical protein